MIKLRDLKIDAKATLGRRIVLTNIAPKYVYEGGKKTDKVEGCYYTVFCQDRQYMTLRVSVPGDARIDDATVDKMPHVEFEELEIHLYYIDKKPIITVTADNVHVAKFLLDRPRQSPRGFTKSLRGLPYLGRSRPEFAQFEKR